MSPQGLRTYQAEYLGQLNESRRDDWKLRRPISSTYTLRMLDESKPLSRQHLQSSLRDFSNGACQPRTASWAKLSRPYGDRVLSRSHFRFKNLP